MDGRHAAEESPLAPWEHSYRLVSLWEIMKLLSATEACNLIELSSRLAAWAPIGEDDPGQPNLAISDLREVISGCEALSLRASGHAARQLLRDIEIRGPDLFESVDLATASRELTTILKLELSAVRFFPLQVDRTGLFEIRQPFGSQVAERFPSCEHDIFEAAKCLAFQRPTATVSHLVRCVEIAIRVLAKRVGIRRDIYETSGSQTIIDLIQKAISAKQATLKKTRRTKRRAAELEFFAEANLRLADAKDAWRNSVSHARRIYTDEEARSIFDSIERLMRHLATELSE